MGRHGLSGRLASFGNCHHQWVVAGFVKYKHLTGGARWSAVFAAGAATILIGLLGLLFPFLERAYLTQLADRETSTLTLAVEGLQGSLQRYEALPGLIADRPDLLRALRDPTDVDLIARLNTDLQHTAENVGLSDVFLIDRAGLTIAASNHWKERPFIGRNFRFRPYFTQALAGRQGRFFALGITSGERGYFFAEPVIDGAEVIGVLAVKFTVNAFEEAWRDDANDIVVIDDLGVIFMASRPEWHFRTVRPLGPYARNVIEATQKYPRDELAPFTHTQTPFSAQFTRFSVSDGDNKTEKFIVQTHSIDDAGWSVLLLTPAQPAWSKAAGTVAVAALLMLLAGLVVTIIIQRRIQLQERMKAALSMQAELEHRVTQRTAELHKANHNILQEVEERRSAEARLRQTQTELVQAGKMAALGQMSAALSHEFNQPLTAVKSFATNVTAYLDRGEPEKVRQNVGMINDMVDRLVAISTHLRNFARRPGEQTEPISLNRALDGALAIVEPKLRATQCVVNWTPLERDVLVMGGQVRLQQVFVNLLSNAADAMQDVDEPVIEVDVEQANHQIKVRVRDRGRGLTQTEMTQLFDPFFTTKDPGKGMGLGLSISYNIIRDFGGNLEGYNNPDGGAVFLVSLVAAQTPSLHQAAE